MNLINSSKLKTKANSLLNKWQSKLSKINPSLHLEHIGSTAIEGAITKGDIDFYLEVPENIHQDTVETLMTLGFCIKPDTHRDKHLCMVENSEVAIQIVAQDSKYTFFKTFRDKLKDDSSLLKQYNDLKISNQNKSESEYRDIKSTFISHVLNS